MRMKTKMARQATRIVSPAANDDFRVILIISLNAVTAFVKLTVPRRRGRSRCRGGYRVADHLARDDFQVGVLVFEPKRVGHEAIVHAGVGLLCPRDLQLVDILA